MISASATSVSSISASEQVRVRQVGCASTIYGKCKLWQVQVRQVSYDKRVIDSKLWQVQVRSVSYDKRVTTSEL